jgi:FkbH-like protein
MLGENKMDGTALLSLPWLLPAPKNFSMQVKEATSAVALLDLCQYGLDINQCEKLSKALLKQGALGELPTKFSLGILSNSTTDLLPAVLRVSAARHGIALTIERPDFDQVMQVALGSVTPFSGVHLDAILVALDMHFFPAYDLIDTVGTLERCRLLCGRLTEALEKNYQVPLIFQTIADSGEALFGSLDLQQAGTRRNTLHHLNTYIADTLCSGPNVLFDVAGLSEVVGLSNWYDPLQYFMAKLPCSQAVLPLYAEHLARLISAMKGKSKKCLVFDLDNTIWGGVIGDDGLDGITLGQGSTGGEAFLAVQKCILDYHQRGVVLAVSSKNTHDIAMQVFEQHADMLIRREHISVFQANWEDKASNINAIAQTLNLGLDAMVFLDDNPVERQQVRDMLPQVAVPELPGDPAYFARVVTAAGYFDAVAFSAEDKERNASYKQNARRIEAFKSLGSLEEYLKSLDMVLTIKPFDTNGLTRIVQLINKTNQFNLTTRRYDQVAVTAMMADPFCITLQARLTDIYGENGMIAVIIAHEAGTELMIDSWLMSCRVLNRQVEYCLMNQLMLIARQRRITAINASYIPTNRNAIVENMYAELGFLRSGTSSEANETWWNLQVNDYKDHEVFIRVEE